MVALPQSFSSGRRQLNKNRGMIKSSVFMGRTCSKQIKLQGSSQFANIVEINDLPDDVIVHILSRMGLKEAARTSVLAHRWRYLWRSVFGTLQFDFRDFVTAAGDPAEVERFVSWVNTVLELHRGGYIEGMAILFEGMHEEQYDLVPRIAPTIDRWVFLAVQKHVERFDLRLQVVFPSIETLRSHSGSPFSRLRSLRLVEVHVSDEVVSYVLASCPYLEHLSIWWSYGIKSIRVVDPPSLRALDLRVWGTTDCVEISAESLVSLSFTGREHSLVVKKIPNLRELTVGNGSFIYFLRVVKEHANPFDHLVKLVVDFSSASTLHPLVGLPDLPRFCFLKRLEVIVYTSVGRSLLYFTSLIEASPQLCEFRMEMSYQAFVRRLYQERDMTMFPAISSAEAVKFEHMCLESVEMGGYLGCSSENELLRELFENAPSIERVVFDTRSDYYDDPSLGETLAHMATLMDYQLEKFQEVGATTRAQSKERAKHFASTSPRHIKYIIS